ncbi:UDP-N-acetylmuramate--L-alanine ligase [Corynebacterium caspium]|uniref:UDP-N-acetylmuramate--L-alanine ligase n=1 Tax=Corynebacterium caspium TaxID=234828 RepID=UPI0003824FC9|nr:UDP-N-acetylmuramate--L-alanine ligase [Corynebacterium caspium]WKD58997.1 UDP-N-acetylmuramate--L-alanine ligase [Corynebacterium caspium DSM 44850]
MIDISRVHMIGIGGAGMSGLAHILLERGSVVSGSDRADSAVIAGLRSAGAYIATTHNAANLSLSGEFPTAVVTSFAAIPKDNPELVAAHEHNIPVLRRSDLLAELMRTKKEILVAGTHGKTSTTSLLVAAMVHAELNPSFAIGGQLTGTGQGAHNGSGAYFIAEADESDGSFLSYHPEIAIITTVEPDHLDFFHTAAAYLQVFKDFIGLLAKPNELTTAGQAQTAGTLIACTNDSGAAQLAKYAHIQGHQVLLYGTAPACAELPEIPAGAVISKITPGAKGSLVQANIYGTEIEFEVSLPGEHMALNAVAAVLAGHLAGGEIPKLAAGISAFGGVRRRFDIRGVIPANNPHFAGLTVVDDYAHHPTEVAAVIGAAKETVMAQKAGGRVIVAFQPHLYSRTQQFAAEFAAALAAADIVISLDIYGAREKPVAGVDAGTIGNLINNYDAGTQVILEADLMQVPAHIKELAGPHDLVITMGAGSITTQAGAILAALEPAEED